MTMSLGSLMYIGNRDRIKRLNIDLFIQNKFLFIISVFGFKRFYLKADDCGLWKSNRKLYMGFRMV